MLKLVNIKNVENSAQTNIEKHKHKDSYTVNIAQVTYSTMNKTDKTEPAGDVASAAKSL